MTFETTEEEGKINWNKIARGVYQWFQDHGAIFFHDTGNNRFMYFEGDVFKMDTDKINNPAYLSMLYKHTQIPITTSPAGRMFHEQFDYIAYEEGDVKEPHYWLHTDRSKHTVFFNLNNGKNEVLKITPDEITIVRNGVNDENIVFHNSPTMMPIEFIPDVDIADAEQLFKSLIFDNLACPIEERVLITTWISCFLLLDFAGTRPLLRFEGVVDSGKSTASKLISALLFGSMDLENTSSTWAVSNDKPTIRLQTSPYSFSGGDILFINNTFPGRIFIDGDDDVMFIAAGNNIGSIDATAYIGRVIFCNNLCHGDAKLMNAATVSGNYVLGALQVISGTTEKTLATGNYVAQGMVLAGDHSAAVGNVIANGGLNVGGKGSRASSNSITGTLSIGFWGSATGNLIRTQKAMAISATVPRAQIVGNITMDEFYVVPVTASGTSATFGGTDVDNFNIGDSVTFQSSKNIETRMISGKSGNTITWNAALNSTYDGEKAFTCLAHLEGISSLSVITGNFVAGDINVVGGTNLSCDFVGSSCVVSGNRVLGVVVINANGKKNCVTGNVITAPVAATAYPKTWPFSSYPPDPSNVIANNVVDGSVI